MPLYFSSLCTCDTFVLVDDDKDGLIDKNQFFTLFRALGQTVSDASLTKIFSAAVIEEAKNAAKAKEASPPAKAAAAAAPKKAAAPPPAGEYVSFQQFVKTFADAYQKPATESALISAFNVFDATNSGKLTMTQLHDILTKRGEPLTKEEVDEIMLLAALDHAKETDYAVLAKR
ncbi:myosin regulatory light chain, putative [Eimeria mitis]|uniref:Myosin regulatory light chain, putative n=1 Tax=Eimeria mitis TaxID=44415 RepID=U6JXF1_9EIME|nr:myosin regulatory light chain, putative [Eimeria mitis]CDJ30099.1 myosin regulatory light chain, putative [Eimeria mitis]